MSDFDPDAYLTPPPDSSTKPVSGAFDPDAYLHDDGKLNAAWQGAKAGATFNFNDELAGIHAAAPKIPGTNQDIPEFAGPIPARMLAGAGRLAANLISGKDSDAQTAYEKARDEERASGETAKSQHPYAYGAGEVAGSIPAMAALPEAGFAARGLQTATKVAKFGREAADAATVGGEFGALSGAGEGTDTNSRLTGAGVGGASGVIGGAIAPAVSKGLGAAYNKFGKPAANIVRGWWDSEGAAATRITGALRADQDLIASGKANGMSPTDWVKARAAGEPVTLADLGSTNTQALLRSAANTSPEGRAMLEKVINDRFLGQSERVANDVRGLVAGGANAGKTADQLVAEYDAARTPAYRRAYQDGDRQIMTPEMERLMGSPTVVAAMHRAETSGKDRAITEGLGAFNPGVTVESGVVKFNKGPTGVPTYPNLQYWDAVKKELDSAATQARRSGDTSSVAGNLATTLRNELDNQVPSYAAARGAASQYFGESNALEAGRKLAGKQFDPATIRTVMAKMNPQERDLFREGYASDWANRVIGNIRDTRDITKAMFNSPNERARAMAIFGPSGMATIQARMTLETIMDGARQAMGNSTTARQLIEAGLAGGVVGGYEGYQHGGLWGGITGAEGGAAAGAIARKQFGNQIARGAGKLIGYVDSNTAKNVAKLLTSSDPNDLTKGLQLATRNQKIANGLKSLATRIGLATQGSAGLGNAVGAPKRIPIYTGGLDGPGTANADENSPQRAQGGKVNPVPESKDALLAQQKQLLDEHRDAQLFPSGKDELKLPKGMYRAKMLNSDVFHYHPKRMNVKRLLAASKAGKENEVLGLGPVTKTEAMHRASKGEHPVAVVERDRKGNETRAAAGTHATAPAQLAALARNKSAAHTLSVEDPADTLALRRLKSYAEGGAVGDDYNTALSPEQESGFQTWKTQNAPNDSGADYDLRGAYLANMQRSADNGHMGDQFKKPNHPTFSDQSQYATGDQIDRAGFWIGPEGPDQTFVPPVATKARGGQIRGYADGGSPTDDTDNDSDAPASFDQRFITPPKPEGLTGTPLITSYLDRGKEPEPGLLSKAGDVAKRFGNYTKQMAGDIIGAPISAYEHPKEAKESVKHLLGEKALSAPSESDLSLASTPVVGPIAASLKRGYDVATDPTRYQTWPERMIRSGATAAGDALSGKLPGMIMDPDTGEWNTNPEMIERAQDMAGMAGGALTTGATDATLGSAPFLRPALKYEGKIYKAPVGGQHLDAIPPDVYPKFQEQAMNGEDISNFNFGFMNHRGQFLDRENALKYGIDNGLLDPQAARQGALTSTILEDSSAGAPLAALEHAQPFYSAVEQTVAKATQQKMHGEQWANWLKNQPGVKPDEMQYTGIDNWLREQKGPVTKQAVQDYIDKNKVQVNDVVKGNNSFSKADLDRRADNYIQDWIGDYHHENGHAPSQYEIDDAREAYHGMAAENDNVPGMPKYSSYQLPGGENYREHLLTLPERNGPKAGDRFTIQERPTQPGLWSVFDNQNKNWAPNHTHGEAGQYANVEGRVGRNQAQEWANQANGRAREGDNYKSSHWDEPNVVAHVRTNDREVTGGYPDNGPKTSHHIEEIQSDWAQSGKKIGFAGREPNFSVRDANGQVQQFKTREEAEAVPGRTGNIIQMDRATGVPDMPFKQTEQWAGLAMKRMIQKAVAEDRSRVSWTPGEAQAARYDLSKQLNSITVVKNGDNKVWHPTDVHGRPLGSVTTNPEGKIIKAAAEYGNNVVGKSIDEAFGKEVAEKGMNSNEPETRLSAQDLKVGGEGMKGFYDQILPKVVEKLGKEWGVKVKEGRLEGKVNDEDYSFSPKIGSNGSKWEIRLKHDDSLATDKEFNSFEEASKWVDDNPTKQNQKVHYFDIPPKMKEDILKKGFPLFSDSSVGAPLAVNSDNNKQQIERPVNKAKTEPEINVPQRASGGRVEAANIDKFPSDRQKHAGNYSKDHLNIHGFELVLEHAKGHKRSGIGPEGPWEVKMPSHYGYIRRAPFGADEAHIDVYLGPHIKSSKVFVVNQIDVDTKKWDEHKVMFGFRDLRHAVETYEKAFTDGKALQRIGSIVPTDVKTFKYWLHNGDTTKPFVSKLH